MESEHEDKREVVEGEGKEVEGEGKEVEVGEEGGIGEV